MKFTAHSVFAKQAKIQSAPRGRSKHQSGQGMTEYLVIVSIVAVAAIGVYSLFGQTLRNQTAGLAMEVAGQDAAAAIGNAQANANTAQGNANTRKGLDNYNLQNRP